MAIGTKSDRIRGFFIRMLIENYEEPEPDIEITDPVEYVKDRVLVG